MDIKIMSSTLLKIFQTSFFQGNTMLICDWLEGVCDWLEGANDWPIYGLRL